MTTNDLPVRFDIYSKNGKLMDSKATKAEAERLMAVWFNAQYVVGVATNGDQIVVAERKELH